MEQNRKRNYKKYQKPHNMVHISTEYVLVKDEVLKADFKTLTEAQEYVKNNPNTEIYIFKTFKLK